jgi:hypothetical protein
MSRELIKDLWPELAYKLPPKSAASAPRLRRQDHNVRADTSFMRKTIATLVVLSLILIGYTAWPLYSLFVLVRAIETRDVDTVVRHVYFNQVHISLTNQIVAAYVRRTGIQISPLARSMGAAALRKLPIQS